MNASKFREVIPGVYRSPLPRAVDIATFAEQFQGRTVVDLTRRERPTIERACAKHRLTYVKVPTDYVGSGANVDAGVNAVLAAEKPVLFHCFHGRDRTGLVARRVTMLTVGRLCLYRVGRNLNRAVRTCEAFGLRTIETVECTGRIEGSLFGAKDRVSLVEAFSLPSGPGVLALETWGETAIDHVDWSGIHTLLVGGETSGLPRSVGSAVRIPTVGEVSGLTVEATVAIALHTWRGQS